MSGRHNGGVGGDSSRFHRRHHHAKSAYPTKPGTCHHGKVRGGMRHIDTMLLAASHVPQPPLRVHAVRRAGSR